MAGSVGNSDARGVLVLFVVSRQKRHLALAVAVR